MGNILNFIFYEPMYNAVVVLYRLSGENLGIAIILIALISRFVMIPLTLRQIKMAESSQEFSKRMKEVKEKYKKDKEAQQREMMKLQSEFLPAQIAGCLPMIFQFIFFIYLYRVISNMINVGAEGFNSVAYSFVDKFPTGYEIHSDFFGILDVKKSAGDFSFSSIDILPYILLILGVGISQYGSMKILMALRSDKKDESKGVEKVGKKKKKKGRKDENKKTEDFSEILQQSTKQTMLIMPFFLMFISFNLPAGLGLYWISQSSFVIIQQFAISRLWKKDEKEAKSEDGKGEIA